MTIVQSTRYLTKRQRAAARVIPKCAVCGSDVSPQVNRDRGQRETYYRGRPYVICGPCRRIYSHCRSQFAWCGTRFRFVRKTEIPRTGESIMFQLVYKVLLLARERQISRQKEVNWMVDEKTRKVIKFFDRAADILVRTLPVGGDDFTVPDDEAITRIRDLLDDIDPEIMHGAFRRVKKKRRR